MDKNDMMQGLQDMTKKPEKEAATASPAQTTEKVKVKAAGRPREHDPYEKTTVTFPAELMGKLRMLCLYNGRQIREVLEDVAASRFTREQAIERAKKYNLEYEVIMAMENGCNPDEALQDWDIYPYENETDSK